MNRTMDDRIYRSDTLEGYARKEIKAMQLLAQNGTSPSAKFAAIKSLFGLILKKVDFCVVFNLIWEIQKEDGQCSLRVLKSTGEAGALEVMIKEGLISKKLNPQDARNPILLITDKGREDWSLLDD